MVAHDLHGPVPHLVDASLDLLIDGEIGIVHLTNRIDDGRGAISWARFARAAAAAAGLDPAGVHAVAASALGQQARRPVNAALASERLWPLPPLSRAIDDYVRDAGVSVDNASTGRIADRDTGAPFATAPTHMMR